MTLFQERTCSRGEVVAGYGTVDYYCIECNAVPVLPIGGDRQSHKQ
jgi:hypothetical protein